MPSSLEARQFGERFNQSGSPLFKLPVELLLKIYRNVLTGHTIHMAQQHRSDTKIARFTVGHCCIPIDSYEHFEWPPRTTCKWSVKKLRTLALTRTCRRVYLDTIHLVYEENVFRVNELRILPNFRALYLTKKLYCEAPQIRYLRLGRPLIDFYEVFELPPTWAEGIQVLQLDWIAPEYLAWAIRPNGQLVKTLLPLRGVDLRHHPALDALKPYDEVVALFDALQETVGQPKSGTSHLSLTDTQMTDAVRALVEKGRKILAEKRLDISEYRVLTTQ